VGCDDGGGGSGGNGGGGHDDEDALHDGTSTRAPMFFACALSICNVCDTSLGKQNTQNHQTQNHKPQTPYSKPQTPNPNLVRHLIRQQKFNGTQVRKTSVEIRPVVGRQHHQHHHQHC